MRRPRRHVGFVPWTEVDGLFDHQVGAGKERRRNHEAERLRRLEVDAELECGRLKDWDFSRLLSSQDPIDTRSEVSEQHMVIRLIGDETTNLDYVERTAH